MERMERSEVKRKLWDLATIEFEDRLSKIRKSRSFDEAYAETSFRCVVFWMFIKFMLDMDMDPDSAYELLRQDRRTLDALFEDAVKEAER